VRRTWEIYGREDPFYAVLTDSTKRGGRWDVEEFFATGRAAVAEQLERVRALGVEIPNGPALDFGCGVGRLTQALAEHFDVVHGVDISEPMLARAGELNRYGPRCIYHLNETSDLSLFPDATFAYVLSVIVLQHNPPKATARYLAEFGRVLMPGGVAVVQIPAGKRNAAVVKPSHRLPPVLRSWLIRLRLIAIDRPAMEMNPVPIDRARAMFASARMEVVAADEVEVLGWRQVTYTVCRPR
jgi:SAM-dependent methyltransferase